jgi:hypothetical protein
MGYRTNNLTRDLRIIASCKAYGLWGRILCHALPSIGLANTRNAVKLRSLKNRHRGQRIFIIGNGPSLMKTNIRRLKNEVTIGCNGIFLMFDEMGFLPTYYTVEDTLVAEDRAEKINMIKGTIKVFPYDLRYCLNPDSDTIFINFQRRYGGFPKFSSFFEKRVYWGGTVTYLNLQLAYYLGAREIYLIGIDHNYNPPSTGDIQQGTVITSHSQDPNHFHPGYFGPGFRYHDPMPERMERAYRKAREFSEKNGIAVYNATEGGKLEVFERINFIRIFNKG